jgi:AcrR family transcriptional regulator
VPGRPTNQKYLKILAAGRDLFWKHGFKRVTIEEVCREAGASKMTFYKFFENKIAGVGGPFPVKKSDGVM